uniref:FkbM family methyltransferase n=1 Tax=Roseihalotalea indica TaxID=2867963 RepID=A0AA49JGR3_9BACT|nr:FkbM family methyltransferase [Tunicatimonas sp. TK19036]
MIKQIIKSGLKAFVSPAIRRRVYDAIGSTLDSSPIPKYNMFRHITILKELGFHPPFIVDVGAYAGEWTKKVLDIYPNATYLMVEAQPSKKNNLEKIAQQYDNVHLEIALLGETEKENIRFFEMETGSSIYEEKTEFKRREIHLNMCMLDSIVSKYEVDRDCFLKLDVQGAEIDVLKGAQSFLSSTEFIMLEASTLNYNEQAPLFAEVIQFLYEKGFILFDICDERRMSNHILFQIDLIFVRGSSPYRASVNF